MARYCTLAFLLCLPGLWLISATSAAAHASEQGFVLLLPTHLYIAAGVAAVAVSILLMAFVPGRRAITAFTPRTVAQLPAAQNLQTASSLLATLGFFALIAVGFIGPHDPQKNLLPLTIWTLWWVGLVAVQGVIGNVWQAINPWSGLARLLARFTPAPQHLPASLASWPAVGFLLAFNLFAMADLAPTDPHRLAGVALAYWGLTMAGMLVFGAETWLSRAECFTVFFRLIASLAPVRWQPDVRIGLPGWQLLRTEIDLSRAMFCLVLLACGSFDGLHETFWWLASIGINPLEFPGRSAVVTSTTLGMLAANLALFGIFVAAVGLGVRLVNSGLSPAQYSRFSASFQHLTLSLLPIAFGYHLAHFLISTLVQSQYALAALADPLARGTDLLGLGPYHVTTGFLNTALTVRLLWLTQAGVVVGAHILSVLIGHTIAHSPPLAGPRPLRLQVGISILMIFYTVFGLWLLATPRGA